MRVDDQRPNVPAPREAPAPAPAGAAEREPPVRAGERVAHYEILGEIGRGGMGVVFRARDSLLQREVALKCPWPVLARDPAARQRFMHEAHAAARLAHPHIVPVFEVLEWDGIPWLAMELIEGRPLRALLSERGALPLEVILRCAEGVADALRAAHAKRILHRDLNPNNVLVTPEAWPFLTDFGLARAFAPQGIESSDSTLSGPLTAEGRVVGTRCYMSPEQVLGRTLDARSDIFSFGAVLYEMCTGRRAFPATEPGAEHDAILHRQPGPIASINREIPDDLDRIVKKALAKRPDERYQDASDLHADLVGLRRRVESGQGAAPGPMPRAVRRTRWAIVAALLALGAAFLVWKAPSLRAPSRAFPFGTPRQITSDPGWESEPALSPDGSLIAYASNASGNPDIWIIDAKGGSPLRLTDDPAADRSPAWFPDGSSLAFVSDRGGETAIWRVPRLGGSAVLLVPNGADPALSPDGARIAFTRPNANHDSRIFVAPVENPSRAVALTDDAGGHWDHAKPAWSPDGRTICYADARNLWLVDVQAGRARRLTSGDSSDREPTWSSDGRFVLFTSYREGTHALWRIAAGGGVPERLTLGAGPEGESSLSRDGSRLVYSTYLDNYDIVVLNLATGRRELIQSLLHESAPTLAPDGSAMVFASTRRGGRYDLWLQPLSDGSPSGRARLLTDLPGSVNTPAFSPDAKWVAFKREHEGRSQVWIVRASGGLPEQFSDGAGLELHPAWSPDGSALAYASERGGQFHIWVAPVREGRRAGPPRQVSSGALDLLPAWSPDGREIAYVGNQSNQVDVWVAATDGSVPPRRIANGMPALGRLRWQSSTGWLWFSRVTSGGQPRLWKVSPEGGEPLAALKPELFEGAAPPGEFDITPDGRVLAFTIGEVRGDIWLLEAEGGNY
jgi:Tol biopolymer transport system component